MKTNTDRRPVLIGCGQITQSEPDPLRAAGPLHLTAGAARDAADDSTVGARIFAALDSLVVIRSFSDTSWRFACPFGRYANPPRTVAAMLGANQCRQLVYTLPGGNMPQWCINALGRQIAAGESDLALICGGEALATQKSAQRAGITLDWTDGYSDEPTQWGIDRRGWSELEDRHQMRGAIYAYPLFENAIRGARRRSLADHQRAMGELLAGFARVAADNPLADRRDGFDASTIATPGQDNPYIGFPYTRLMNANAFIDQSAAVILASEAKARELGVPRDRWVYLHGCADAHDHWFISDRRDLHSSPAMETVFRQTLAMANLTVADIDSFDLYSCFASAVQVACDALGLAVNDKRGLTVTGGLPYFGGPGNNYVTHAIAQMMQQVRARPGTFGMVTANGNYLTKHSAGIYSTEPPAAPFAPADIDATQRDLDRVGHPPVTELADGAATVETWTVMNDRNGPAYAIVIGRLNDNSRFIANTPPDRQLLQQMQIDDFLGRSGQVSHNGQTNVFVPH